MTDLLIEEKPEYTGPVFDKKYKIVIKCKFTDEYFKMVDWVNENSQGLVDIRFNAATNEIDTVFVAFEDLDDALVFKIKYSL
jgi:hypothetical protein